MAIEIEYFELSGGYAPVLDYLKNLDEKPQKKLRRNLKRLKDEGFNLLRSSDIFSKVKTVEDIYELKAKFRRMEYRILCGNFQSKIYLLHAFTKKAWDLKSSDVDLAVQRLNTQKSKGG